LSFVGKGDRGIKITKAEKGKGKGREGGDSAPWFSYSLGEKV